MRSGADTIHQKLKENRDKIDHQTVFIPYYAENDGLDEECSIIISQLDKNGRQRGIKSEKKLKKYLTSKIF